ACDASTSFGVGVFIDGAELSLPVHPGWATQGRDIAWLEAVAVEVALEAAAAKGISDCRLRINTDNTSVFFSERSGFSRNGAIMEVLARIRDLEAQWWFRSWFQAPTTSPTNPLGVIGTHLRNFVVQSCTRRCGSTLDDEAWKSIQPILSSSSSSRRSGARASHATTTPNCFPSPLHSTPYTPLATSPRSAMPTARRGETSLVPLPFTTTTLPRSSSRALPPAPSNHEVVTASDRLLAWIPPGSSLLSARDPDQRQRVLAAACASSTRSTYGTGLLRWLLCASIIVFLNALFSPPVSTTLLTSLTLWRARLRGAAFGTGSPGYGHGTSFMVRPWTQLTLV
ncbi:hypothetical protein CF327_g7492, partial [Tilletia walkeri]